MLFSLYITLFIAGMLTILLPCIFPLIPIVLGVSIAGRSKWRPLLTIAGMLVSFVGFTFLLTLVLNQFIELADYLRIGTYYVLLLFGLGFAFHNRLILYGGSLLGGFFFLHKGWTSVAGAAVIGMIAMHLGGRIASRIQQIGTDIQLKTKAELGQDSPMTAFIIGLTMGLVWVPCAGPALGFAFTLVREQPGPLALGLLTTYGIGTAVPLLLIGYGGQYAAHSVSSFSRFTGHIKRIAGVILILTALSLNYGWIRSVEEWVIHNTSFGTLGTDLEEKLVGDNIGLDVLENLPSIPHIMDPSLPKISRAPELKSLEPWHNSEPFTMADLKGKVVLVDFWTYSCINCIRTLPYIQGYWEKYKDAPFVLLGVHSPEFVFEKSEANVAAAIKRHGLTYPIAQDNDFETWRAFANRYWPAKYLIDADGYVRYTHFGEGAYDETDKAIAALLEEIGYTADGQIVEVEPRGQRQPLTPETYLGARSWPTLGNKQGDPTDDVLLYKAPSSMEINNYYLVGEWQLRDNERQVLQSEEGEIRMKFLGGEINLVLGVDDDMPPASVTVEVDGKHFETFEVREHDLYNLYMGDYGEHDVVIHIKGVGLAGYAFTFGA